MTKNKFFIKIPILLVVLVALLLVSIFAYKVFYSSNSNLQPSSSAEVIKPNSPIFNILSKWYPGEWSKLFKTEEVSGLGNFKGQKITLNITSHIPSIPHFEDENYLTSLGFTQSTDLSADGPGSSVWGYSKEAGGKTQIVLFSYQTKPTSSNPNEPLQFNCPCQITLSVFVSNPIGSLSQDTTSMANPASQNCISKGGALVIKKDGSGGEYGLCDFGDNMACEEWALFRGNCPVGGVKTTGFDNINQNYCAWLGGQTFAIPYAKCTLPSGKVCDDKELFDGACTQN